MELRLKPLRKLVKAHYRKPTPNTNWTPELTELFFDLKTCITSLPALARFDPSKSTFLCKAIGEARIMVVPMVRSCSFGMQDTMVA